jgi:hypothetical protein
VKCQRDSSTTAERSGIHASPISLDFNANVGLFFGSLNHCRSAQCEAKEKRNQMNMPIPDVDNEDAIAISSKGSKGSQM